MQGNARAGHGGGLDVNFGSTTQDTGGTTTDVQKAAEGTKDAAEKLKDSADKTKSALDKVIESLNKLYDWIDVRTNHLRSKADLKLAQADNQDTAKEQNKFVKKAYNYVKKLLEVNKDAVQKYREQADEVAKKVGLSSKLKKQVDYGTVNIEDLDEKDKKRVDAYKQWVDKMNDAKKSVLELRKELKDLNAQKLDNIIDEIGRLYDFIEVRTERLSTKSELKLARGENAVGYEKKNAYVSAAQNFNQMQLEAQQKAVEMYQEKADEVAKQVGLSDKLRKKVDNGTLDIKTLSEANQKRVEAYKEWADKVWDARLAVEELIASQRELAQQKLDNIIEQYDAYISRIEHSANLLNGFIEESELKGYVQSTKYYDALITNKQKTITKLEEQLEALKKTFQESVDSGIIKEGSIEWYNMKGQINGVVEEIQKANNEILQFNNNIRDIEWEKFDRGQSAIKRIVDEADFLIELMSNDKLFTDNGKFTDQGLATAALHGINYNTYMNQADRYREEMERINSELASDPYNIDLLERREELLDLQRESILAAEQEKQAIKDLIKNGIEAELDSLQDLIDKYNDALDAQKDLFDYQKDMAKQARDLAALRKQLAVAERDDSEEGRMRAQQLRNQIQEAQENIEESEYDKFIDDQKELLDDLFAAFEDAMNSRLDDTDAIVESVIEEINANAGDIRTTLETEAGNVGTTITDALDMVLGDGSSVVNMLSMYSDNFSSQMTTLNTTVDSILKGVGALYDQADKIAQNNISQLEQGDDIEEDMLEVVETVYEEGTVAEAGILNNTGGNTGGGSTSQTQTQPSTTGPTTPGVTQTGSKNVQSATDQTKDKLNDKLIDEQIKQIIRRGTKHSKTISASEKANHSSLWEHIVKNHQYSINEDLMKELANVLGIKVSKKLNDTEKKKIRAALVKRGFKNGVHNFTKDENRWVAEDGKEYIIRKADGALLEVIHKGDSVLTSKQAETLYQMAANPQKVFEQFSKPNTSQSSVRKFESSVVNNISFELGFPNVMNCDQFISQLKSDGRLEKYLTAAIAGRMNGKSAMNKYKY